MIPPPIRQSAAVSNPPVGDQSTGWSERAETSHLGLPDEEFDYDEFVRREFEPERQRPRGAGWLWAAVAAVLLIAFALMTWRGF